MRQRLNKRWTGSRRRRMVGLAVTLAVTAGCTVERSDECEGADCSTTTTSLAEGPATTTTAPPATSTPATLPPPPIDQVSIVLTEVAEFDEPTAFATRGGDSSLYVTERAGEVRRVNVFLDEDGQVDDYELFRTPVLDITDEVLDDGSEQGLLGLAFSSDGRTLFVAYTGNDGQQHLDAYDVGDPGAASVRARDGRTLLVVPDFAGNHNGGQLNLGPDGFLWWGMGDGGGGGDPEATGQNPGDLLGSIIRIDPGGGDPYAIPDSNPFRDGGGAPEVYAFGLRNPWRFSFDRLTGDLWIADVGQNAVEEINFAPASTQWGRAANYGWNILEGDQPFSGAEAPATLAPPLFTYDHSAGACSVTGGYVYRGAAIPALQGAYLYGDYCVGEIRALAQQDGQVVVEASLRQQVSNLSSFGEDEAGELYVLSLSGPLYRIDPG